MDDRVLERMRARAHDVRTRAVIRSWSYRQRELAAGVWFRVRRALARARAAYVISDEDARRLVAEGYEPEACGRQLVPEKTILFVGETRLARVDSCRAFPVGLGVEFFAGSSIALVPFDSDDYSTRRRDANQRTNVAAISTDDAPGPPLMAKSGCCLGTAVAGSTTIRSDRVRAAGRDLSSGTAIVPHRASAMEIRHDLSTRVSV